MKQQVTESLRKTKEENSGIMEMQQQLEQAKQQMEQMEKELQKAQQALQKNDQEKFALEKAKLEHDKEIEWYKAKNDKKYQEESLKMDQKHIEAEVLELYDGNPKNDEIKNRRK